MGLCASSSAAEVSSGLGSAALRGPGWVSRRRVGQHGRIGRGAGLAAHDAEETGSYEDLSRGADGNQVFVAMSFDVALHPVFDSGIRPAILAADPNLPPFIMRTLPHNDRIDAQIEVESRKSALVIADVTQNRPGVYYHAGLARGWGTPVIWTARQDEIDNKTVHFDTRQFLRVVWRTPEDLAAQVKPHIENTFLAQRRALRQAT